MNKKIFNRDVTSAVFFFFLGFLFFMPLLVRLRTPPPPRPPEPPPILAVLHFEPGCFTIVPLTDLDGAHLRELRGCVVEVRGGQFAEGKP